MNNLNYKKKYLKYKIKYNNLKLYGGDPQTEATDIINKCKFEDLNNDEKIDECQDKINNFKKIYESNPEVLTKIKTQESDLIYSRINNACKTDNDEKNIEIMYSPTECKELIDIVKPQISKVDEVVADAAGIVKDAAGIVKDAAKTGVNVGVDAAKAGVDAAKAGVNAGVDVAKAGVNAGVKAITNLFSWNSKGGGKIPDVQLESYRKKSESINKSYLDILSTGITKFYGSLNDLVDSSIKNLVNLVGLSFDFIKSTSEYKDKKKILDDKLKILKEKESYLTKLIDKKKLQKAPSIDLVSYSDNLSYIEKSILKIEEKLSDLDSPFELITIGFLYKITQIATNPLHQIKEIIINYLYSSIKLIDLANEINNYESIINKYLDTYEKKKPNCEKYIKKLKKYKEKIIVTKIQIKNLVDSQVENIENINQPESTDDKEKENQKKKSIDKFKTTLELSLDSNLIIRKTNKIIEKIHRIFLLLDKAISCPNELIPDTNKNKILVNLKKFNKKIKFDEDD